MELENLSEEVRWAALRVAAAFEVEIWDGGMVEPLYANLMGTTRWGTGLVAQFLVEPCPHRKSLWWRFGLHNYPAVCTVEWQSEPHYPHYRWAIATQTGLHELMARGLYRLGFEDENVLAQLPSLSKHEQLELRLSMPRELWPPKWFEEEK